MAVGPSSSSANTRQWLNGLSRQLEERRQARLAATLPNGVASVVTEAPPQPPAKRESGKGTALPPPSVKRVILPSGRQLVTVDEAALAAKSLPAPPPPGPTVRFSGDQDDSLAGKRKPVETIGTSTKSPVQRRSTIQPNVVESTPPSETRSHSPLPSPRSKERQDSLIERITSLPDAIGLNPVFTPLQRHFIVALDDIRKQFQFPDAEAKSIDNLVLGLNVAQLRSVYAERHKEDASEMAQMPASCRRPLPLVMSHTREYVPRPHEAAHTARGHVISRDGEIIRPFLADVEEQRKRRAKALKAKEDAMINNISFDTGGESLVDDESGATLLKVAAAQAEKSSLVFGKNPTRGNLGIGRKSLVQTSSSAAAAAAYGGGGDEQSTTVVVAPWSSSPSSGELEQSTTAASLNTDPTATMDEAVELAASLASLRTHRKHHANRPNFEDLPVSLPVTLDPVNVDTDIANVFAHAALVMPKAQAESDDGR